MGEKGFFPKRRFKQFTEEWLGDKLDNLLELLKDGTHGTHKNVDKGIYLLSAKNIKNGEIQISEEERMISIEEYKKIHKYFSLKKGDVLLTIVGSIGESAIIDDPNGYTFQRSVAYLRPKKEINSEFLYAKINSHVFQQKLINRQVLSAQAGIYLRDLSDIFIIFPNVKEQQKIGEFFKVLDERIANQERKIAKVKALKSAYLTEMFPQEGETVPKRRFKGFVGEWETKDFKDVADYRHGKAHEQNVVDNGKYVIVNSRFISTNGIKRKYSNLQIEALYTGELAFVLSDIPNGRALSKTYLINQNNLYTLNQRILGITPKEKTDSYFLKEMINRHDYFLSFDDGSNQTNLSNQDLENFEFRCPNINEQQKIGAFFKNLDDQITTEEKKLEKLKKMKEAYLEEMFV